MKKRVFNLSESKQLTRLVKVLTGPLEAGHPLTITVEPYKRKRSVDQNARYWAMLNEISQQMPALMDGQWYSPEVWHEYCKRRFLGIETTMEFRGKAIPIPKSTRRLSVTEFMGYCDEIQAWAHESGVMFTYGEAIETC